MAPPHPIRQFSPKNRVQRVAIFLGASQKSEKLTVAPTTDNKRVSFGWLFCFAKNKKTDQDTHLVGQKILKNPF
jgi:hypothetical protein